MNACAEHVMRVFPDVILAFGHSDEYSFIIRADSTFFSRRRSKLLSTFVSVFSSAFVLYWPFFFGATDAWVEAQATWSTGSGDLDSSDREKRHLSQLQLYMDRARRHVQEKGQADLSEGCRPSWRAWRWLLGQRALWRTGRPTCLREYTNTLLASLDHRMIVKVPAHDGCDESVLLEPCDGRTRDGPGESGAGNVSRKDASTALTEQAARTVPVVSMKLFEKFIIGAEKEEAAHFDARDREALSEREQHSVDVVATGAGHREGDEDRSHVMMVPPLVLSSSAWRQNGVVWKGPLDPAVDKTSVNTVEHKPSGLRASFFLPHPAVAATPMLYAPAFDGRVFILPTQQHVMDYLRWRQVDGMFGVKCHARYV